MFDLMHGAGSVGQFYKLWYMNDFQCLSTIASMTSSVKPSLPPFKFIVAELVINYRTHSPC